MSVSSTCILMSSPAILPLPSSSPSMALKRPRSDSADSMGLARIVKVCKRSIASSPASEVSKQQSIRNTQWPVVRGCPTICYAISFLQKSRQHAMQLLWKQQWERALGVLEKVEKASEMVSKQRRKHVLEQVRTTTVFTCAVDEKPATTRRVRFDDHVQVATAECMDRSSTPLTSMPRDEILLLRAARCIPPENFSEFWN